MPRTPNKQMWRRFFDRVLHDDKYQTVLDTEKHGPYHTYREVFIQIDKILKRHPRSVEPIPVGTSAAGETLWMFRVVSDVTGKAERLPRFLVSSAIHAQEFISAEINLALFERFTNNMRQNKTLWGREVYFFPIMNPDGYLRVEQDLADGQRHFTRTNRNGVDLNRNFSTFFSRQYWLHRFFPKVWYPGYRPFSEPETAGFRKFLLETRFDYALSLHAFGGWFFYPYAGSKLPSRDEQWFRETCGEMIERQPMYGYKSKQLGKFLPFFRARGTETDYLYEVFGTRSILIEIGRRGLKTFHPRVLFSPFHWFNPHDPAREVENLIEPLFWFLSLPRMRKVD